MCGLHSVKATNSLPDEMRNWMAINIIDEMNQCMTVLGVSSLEPESLPLCLEVFRLDPRIELTSPAPPLFFYKLIELRLSPVLVPPKYLEMVKGISVSLKKPPSGLDAYMCACDWFRTRAWTSILSVLTAECLDRETTALKKLGTDSWQIIFFFICLQSGLSWKWTHKTAPPPCAA